jgi:uncharacterized protein (TIGR04255 family)
MSEKMRSAPVYFTIGQVQHNPLLDLNAYIPVIQERMRKEGFPDFKSAIQMQFAIPPPAAGESGQAFQPAVHKLERFLFSNIDGTSGFVLQASSLSFQTTEYDTIESFIAQLKVGLSILGDAVGGLDFFERLGLRYLNVIAPLSGKSLNQYLEAELLGLPASVHKKSPGPKFAYSFTEALLLEEGVGQVVSRAIIQTGPLSFPADLLPEPLKVAERFRSLNQEHAVLDMDGSFFERNKFDVAMVESRFKQLRGLIETAFQASVTTYALQVWKEGEKQ